MLRRRSSKATGIDPEKRFLKKVVPGVVSEHRPDLGPCLVFNGASNGNGYRQFRYGHRNGYAHRYAWERIHGPIPPGLTIDHLCMNRACVNIDHLELVDGATNTRRGVAARTFCNNGHPYPPEQLATSDRKCKICLQKQWTRRESKLKRTRMRHPDYIKQMRKTDPAELSAAVDLVLAYRSNPSAEGRRLGINASVMERHVWKAAKRRTLERDSETCQRCHAVGVDVHHRRARKSGGRKGNAAAYIAYSYENTVTLCRECHRWAEEHPSAAYETGWRLHEWDDPETVPMVNLYGHWFLFDGDRRVDL